MCCIHYMSWKYVNGTGISLSEIFKSELSLSKLRRKNLQSGPFKRWIYDWGEEWSTLRCYADEHNTTLLCATGRGYSQMGSTQHITNSWFCL